MTTSFTRAEVSSRPSTLVRSHARQARRGGLAARHLDPGRSQVVQVADGAVNLPAASSRSGGVPLTGTNLRTARPERLLPMLSPRRTRSTVLAAFCWSCLTPMLSMCGMVAHGEIDRQAGLARYSIDLSYATLARQPWRSPQPPGALIAATRRGSRRSHPAAGSRPPRRRITHYPHRAGSGAILGSCASSRPSRPHGACGRIALPAAPWAWARRDAPFRFSRSISGHCALAQPHPAERRPGAPAGGHIWQTQQRPCRHPITSLSPADFPATTPTVQIHSIGYAPGHTVARRRSRVPRSSPSRRFLNKIGGRARNQFEPPPRLRFDFHSLR